MCLSISLDIYVLKSFRSDQNTRNWVVLVIESYSKYGLTGYDVFSKVYS